MSVVGAAIQYSLTFTGVSGVDAGLAALVMQLEVPFLVLLGALFLGERPGLRRWLGMAVAFAGVGLIAGQAAWCVRHAHGLARRAGLRVVRPSC